MRYRNVSGARRVWPSLTNAETGRTLELDDGDDAEVVEDVSDPRLAPVADVPVADVPVADVPVAVKAAKTKPAPADAVAPDPAAADAVAPDPAPSEEN